MQYFIKDNSDLYFVQNVIKGKIIEYSLYIVYARKLCWFVTENSLYSCCFLIEGKVCDIL